MHIEQACIGVAHVPGIAGTLFGGAKGLCAILTIVGTIADVAGCICFREYGALWACVVVSNGLSCVRSPPRTQVCRSYMQPSADCVTRI